MKEHPTWSIIIAGIGLCILGYFLGGFFIINYFIGGAGIFLGVYNIWRKK
ncbi:MAG TPA: hypothetical protein HA360_00825 [Nanoarchaeota archaeon]|nr:hypothetical protein [Candidatus Woesearchaeota archaeon]HIH15672.1 hypothetical protein [Nanoarchaeota archaeon]HIH59326.1 hypothetical protein [Nanoarchaeota archaeon]HII13595.1 hypothetical protein [Nanoarchaeota archaeon]HIJ04830.1 hypothetical protein [Nanoarchaeota archaeon]